MLKTVTCFSSPVELSISTDSVADDAGPSARTLVESGVFGSAKRWWTLVGVRMHPCFWLSTAICSVSIFVTRTSSANMTQATTHVLQTWPAACCKVIYPQVNKINSLTTDWSFTHNLVCVHGNDLKVNHNKSSCLKGYNFITKSWKILTSEDCLIIN